MNADQIPARLQAYAPENALFEVGHIMLKRLRELAESDVSFTFGHLLINDLSPKLTQGGIMVSAFQKKNTLEQTGFMLVEDGFSYCSKVYKFEDVIETRIIRSVLEHKIILVGSDYHHSVSIMIGVKSGELLQVTEQPTWLSDSKLSSVEHVENIFAVISQKSWDNRVQKYTRNIDAQGFFEYNGWRLYINQRKIQNIQSGKYYDLDSVNLFKSYGFIEVKDKNEGFGPRLVKRLVGGQVGIGTLIDTDVFFALLKHFFSISWPDQPAR